MAAPSVTFGFAAGYHFSIFLFCAMDLMIGLLRLSLQDTDSGYVQEALHKEVDYATAGKVALSPAYKSCYAFVLKHMEIPADFDKRHG